MHDSAASTSSDVPMLQADSTAGRTAAVLASESTTSLPANSRTTSAPAPATTKPTPTDRSAWRRRPATAIAAAKSSRASAVRMKAASFRYCATSWAAAS